VLLPRPKEGSKVIEAARSDTSGIRLPSKHRIYPRTPEGQSLAEPLFVSIDFIAIAFT